MIEPKKLPCFDSAHSRWSLSKGYGTCSLLETLKLRSCWNNKKGPTEDPLGKMGPVWSLLVENKAPAKAKSFNCVGRSSSYCCSARIISKTRSIACANSSWHDSTSAHRLHIYNRTVTTTHFPSLSQSNTLDLRRDVLPCREEMISQHWNPSEKQLSSRHCNCVG